MKRPNVVTLPGALAIGEPVVAYSGAAARCLGSVPAAVLVSQLWYLTCGGDVETSATVAGIESMTGLSADQQARARKLLVQHGWISERRLRSNGKMRIHTALNARAIVADVRTHHASTPPPPPQETRGEPPKETWGETKDLTPGNPALLERAEERTEEGSEPKPPQETKALAAPEDLRATKQPKEYRVDAGTVGVRKAVQMLADLDERAALDKEAMTALMVGLTALRVGDSTSPYPMPFATYSGADCALVRRKLSTMKPSELAKAVLGATHVDTWARERGLSLAQILGRCDHYVAAFEQRAQRPDKARATAIFINVFNVARSLAVEDVPEWESWRRRVSFMQPAELLDCARQMASVVDKARAPRGSQPLAVQLRYPELNQGASRSDQCGVVSEGGDFVCEEAKGHETGHRWRVL
jgi:hypothetical protein